MPICGLCQKNVDQLVDSHVIPKAITRGMQGKSGKPLAAINLRHNTRGNPVTKNYGGIYAQIVCADCERVHFQDADTYLVDFRRNLLLKRTKYKLHPNGGAPSLRLRQHAGNPDLVHRFAIQTIFRAHLSQRSECDQINLANNESLFRELVISPASTLDSDWHVSLRLVIHPLADLLQSPSLVNSTPPFFTIALPNLTILVAASKAGLPPGFSDVRLRKGEPLTVWHSKRLASNEMNLITTSVSPWLDEMDRILGS